MTAPAAVGEFTAAGAAKAAGTAPRASVTKAPARRSHRVAFAAAELAAAGP